MDCLHLGWSRTGKCFISINSNKGCFIYPIILHQIKLVLRYKRIMYLHMYYVITTCLLFRMKSTPKNCVLSISSEQLLTLQFSIFSIIKQSQPGTLLFCCMKKRKKGKKKESDSHDNLTQRQKFLNLQSRFLSIVLA